MVWAWCACVCIVCVHMCVCVDVCVVCVCACVCVCVDVCVLCTLISDPSARSCCLGPDPRAMGKGHGGGARASEQLGVKQK